MNWLLRTRILAVALGTTLVAPSAALSQSAEEFFGKNRIVMYIGSAPGAGYDLYGRAVARHMGRHLPGNPTLVPSNMPGAGSIVLANFMYARAPEMEAH